MSSRAKRVGAAAAFSLVVLAALTGGAGTGAAGGTVLTPLLSELESIGSVNAGGTVGYAASVENTGTSTVAHVVFEVGTAGAGTYRASQVLTGSAATAACAAGKTNTSLVCTASQLAPHEKIIVNVAFSTSESDVEGSLVSTASATVSAQTNGKPGNNGTSTWFSEPVTTTLTATSDLSFRTFSLPGDDPLETGVSLKTKIELPSAFLNGHFGLVTGISEFSDPANKLCDKCPTVFSGVTIPASLTAANPFSSSNFYSFTVTLAKDAQPAGYKLAGYSHLADGLDPAVRANWVSVPLCTSATAVEPGPICLDGAPSKDKKTGVITATGRGFVNGSGGWD